MAVVQPTCFGEMMKSFEFDEVARLIVGAPVSLATAAAPNLSSRAASAAAPAPFVVPGAASSAAVVAVVVACVAAVAVVCAAAAAWGAVRGRKPAVYCVESSVFVPPESWRIDHQQQKNIARAQGCYNEESFSLMERTLDKSAIGDTAHMPPAYHPCTDGQTKGEFTMSASREEAEAVVFPIVREVLEKSGLSPRDIDFLVVNCSLFVPTPSLCAMICNKFGFREDIRSYNLGGMGCSANVISVDLARQLLENQRGARALVVSTEIITPNMYRGNDKSMLVQNTLFRAGGVALVLSSRRRDASHAKYELLFSGRTHRSDDASYGAVFQKEDSEGQRGVALSKEIVKVAGGALTAQFKTLGRRILPISEQAKVGLNILLTLLVKKAQVLGLTEAKPPKPYVPDFSRAVQHFCIHAGGRAIIDGVQKTLGLEDRYMQASRSTLYEFGNTSSSSVWYEMEWLERFGDMRRGEKALQITFGSGFKCNSAVWRVLRVDESKRCVPIKSVITPSA